MDELLLIVNVIELPVPLGQLPVPVYPVQEYRDVEYWKLHTPSAPPQMLTHFGNTHPAPESEEQGSIDVAGTSGVPYKRG